MITYYDLIKDKTFRDFVQQTLAQRTDNTDYTFLDRFPYLYKYRAISEYSVKDLLSNSITATSVGEFNDIFDSTVSDIKRRESLLFNYEQEQKLIKNVTSILPEEKREDTIEKIHEHYEKNRQYEERIARSESRYKFRLLPYLNTFAVSYSTSNNSVLMWSHYAGDNTGVCIGYDFNKLNKHSNLRNQIFPMAYSKTPIRLSDLLDSDSHEGYQYKFDGGVLCAALNKSNEWAYEKEWRMVCVDAHIDQHEPRKTINLDIIPETIYLGYHFLKPCFHYDKDDDEKKKKQKQYFHYVMNIIDYAIDNEICLCIMRANIGMYDLIPVRISAQSLKSFIESKFKNQKGINIRFYYVIHDSLIELLESEGEPVCPTNQQQ